MIKINFRDELGNVEASFDSIEQYEQFKEQLVSRQLAEKEAALAKKIKEAQEFAKRLEVRWNELKKDALAFVEKAKEYGVAPDGIFRIVNSAMHDVADDRCAPAPEDEEEAQSEPEQE